MEGKINVFKKVILPVKILFAYLITVILTSITWAVGSLTSVMLPDIIDWEFNLVKIFLFLLLVVIKIIYGYTTFKWLFYDYKYMTWKW